MQSGKQSIYPWWRLVYWNWNLKIKSFTGISLQSCYPLKFKKDEKGSLTNARYVHIFFIANQLYFTGGCRLGLRYSTPLLFIIFIHVIYFLIQWSHVFPIEYQTSMCAFFNISIKSWKYSVICAVVKSFFTVYFQDLVVIMK